MTPDPNEDFCRKLCEENVNPLTIKSRLWKLKNPEATREMSRRGSRKFKASNPDIYRAHRTIYRAVVGKRIIKPEHCSKCGASGRIEAHHHLGYERVHRLDVVWLCIPCHRLADKARVAPGSTEGFKAKNRPKDPTYLAHDPGHFHIEDRPSLHSAKLIWTRSIQTCTPPHGIGKSSHLMPINTDARVDMGVANRAWSRIYTCLDCMDIWLSPPFEGRAL